MRYRNAVIVWLWVGVCMIAVQILVGGITRLTGSGLSITKWEIVTGTLPPMNEKTWMQEFDLYRETPQYSKINQGMTLGEFKFIYFWEYFHRLWARLFGLVFLFPFIYFLWRKQIDRPLIKRLLVLVGLGAVVASFGWIMVASGLVDRPWVNAYKLSLHLNLGLLLFGTALWITLFAVNPDRVSVREFQLKRLLNIFVVTLVVQLLLGGLMSGMKAGLYYPSWPDMNNQFIPRVLMDGSNWTLHALKEYDRVGFAPALVQFMHRITAYILAILGVLIWMRAKKVQLPRVYWRVLYLFFISLICQVLLGVLTVINCVGVIPVSWGVAHQAGAIFLIASTVLLVYHTKSE